MPVHRHLTMARALKGNDIPIFGRLPSRNSWGVVMRSWERVTNPWEHLHGRLTFWIICRAVNLSHPQILRIDGEGMIGDIIMHGRWGHCATCCWNCNIWPNWFTSHQSHYCLYYNGIPEFVRKRSMLTVRQLKQRKIFEISLSESRIYKKWQTLAIIQEISDSNLEIGRNGSKSGVSQII